MTKAKPGDLRGLGGLAFMGKDFGGNCQTGIRLVENPKFLHFFDFHKPVVDRVLRLAEGRRFGKKPMIAGATVCFEPVRKSAGRRGLGSGLVGGGD